MNLKALIVLFIGIQAAATSILFIKASTIEPITLAAYRLVIAAVFLTPLYIKNLKKNPGNFNKVQLKQSLLPGLFLSVHFVLWLSGGRMTPAVNASLIINLSAVIMPFLLYFFGKEVVNRNELIATFIILAGLVILGFTDFNLDPKYLMGDLVCFAGMIFLTLYLLMAKINQNTPNIWIYVVPVYYIAGLFCLIGAFFFENPLQVYASREYLIALGLGLIPTVVAHSSLNYAMRNLRGQIVGILNTSQFILAGIWAYYLFNEKPSFSFYFIAPIILAGIFFAIISSKKKTS